MRAHWRSLAALTALAVSGCSGCSGGPSAGDAPAGSAEPPGPGDGPVRDRVVAALFDMVPLCDVEHRGVLVDLGTSAALGRVTARGSDVLPMQDAEHGGATWSVVSGRGFDVRFVLAERRSVFAAARIDAIAARGAQFYVDDLLLGSARLKAGVTAEVHTGPTSEPLDAGEHVLGVRFTPARAKDTFAHVDWVRVGFPDESQTTYGAPTMDDLLMPAAALAKEPHRAISLRAPALVRCPLRVPAGARLRTAVGRLGTGDGEAEIVARVDDGAPVTLARLGVHGGDDVKWESMEANLDAFAGRLVHLELRAPAGAASGRVLFGDPEVLVPTAAPLPTPEAQVVVVVVFSGVDREDLPGYARPGAPKLERLTGFADRAVTFKNHRAPSNVVPAVIATMVTGLPPRAHTVTDYGARLPDGVANLTAFARSASWQVAFFSGVPHSFAPSGLAPSASELKTSSPVSGEAVDPLVGADRWVRATLARDPSAKLLVIVHARGGHPPWAVSPKQLESLPPENYTGDLVPRRAGQQLGALRRQKGVLDLSEQDLVRLGALYRVALVEQDRLLGNLLDGLSEANVDDKTMVVVTSDISSGLLTLFSDAPPIEERALELPLYVAFPKGRYAGRAAQEPTEVADLAASLMSAMGLPAFRHGLGRDLALVASGAALPDAAPFFATSGDRALVRWGRLVLRQRTRGEPTLCDLEVDPTCAFDRRPLFPLAAGALERHLARHEARTLELSAKPEGATFDDETMAALRVWGAME